MRARLFVSARASLVVEVREEQRVVGDAEGCARQWLQRLRQAAAERVDLRSAAYAGVGLVPVRMWQG